jgi:hypothetical protein
MAALVAIGSLLIVGVADNLTEGAVVGAGTLIRDRINPPTFVVSYSKAVEPLPSVTITRLETGEPVQIKKADADALVVASGAGNYRLRLQRAYEGELEALPIHLAVKGAGDMVQLDTADEKWESVAALARDGDTTGSARARSILTDTRWTVSALDRAQVKLAPTVTNGRIVELALADVGLREDGSPEERSRIARYWRRTSLASERGTSADSLTFPWGGTFLGYVVRSAGAEPPASAPAFMSWQTWGDAVPADAAAPGDIVIYSRGKLGPMPRLFAGVMLKRHANCIDVVAGNVADRVVITCVRTAPLAVRRASPD